MLKGIAIIGVFTENGLNYIVTTPAPLAHDLVRLVDLAAGPFVHLFFVLSGFGLMLSYLRQEGAAWSWKKWAWRRFTRIYIPYAIGILFMLAMGAIGARLYPAHPVPLPSERVTWSIVLAYATFTRNFFPATWDWNEPLWFMPVIVGLYLSFPILVRVQKRWGAAALLAGALAVTYATLTFAGRLGMTGRHQSDWFTFWLFQFALGMVLAEVRATQPVRMRWLLGIPALAVGTVAIVLSWGLRQSSPSGRLFNDAITTVGIFVLLLNAGWALRALVPAVGDVLGALAGQEYLMYLLHVPLLWFVLIPALPGPVHPLAALLFVGAYVCFMYGLCRVIGKPLDALIARAYALH